MRLEHWIYSIPLRLRSLFLRRRVEQELDEELQYHLDQKTAEYIRQGLPAERARQAALRAMEGITQHKEECRDARHVNVIDNTFRDIRYGVRVLSKSPGFTAVAVATLALAIGANAVVFGVLNAFILRPLHVPQPESLYGIELGAVGYQSYPDYIDLRDRNRTFESLAAYSISQVGLEAGDTPSRLWIYETSGNYFDALGIHPYLGRFFKGADEHGPNSAPYIVLSYAFWHSHFADDRSVVGRVVRLNKHPFTILGVSPPDFHGTLLFFSPDSFVPMVNHQQLDGQNDLDVRATRWVFMAAGHLKAGVTKAQAEADLNSIGAWLEKTYPKDDGKMKFSLARPALYGNFLGRPVRAFVTALTLLAGLILLAACANLGSLFAARAADRSREVALRMALGGSRSRILRQLFTEATMVALAGGVAGLCVSIVLLQRLSMWQPFPRFPIHLAVDPDAKVYAMAIVLALVSGILFSIVPLRQVMRADAYQIVKAGTNVMLRQRIAVRDLLLAVQVAICAVLVTSSIVAVRGLVRSMHSDFGFEPGNAMLVNTDLNMAGYTGDGVPAMQKRMIEAAAAIPGVESVAIIDKPPLSMDGTTSLAFADDAIDVRPATAKAEAYMYFASPDYFRASGTTLLAGSTFTWHDDAAAKPVAVVNREFARRVFGSINAAVGGYFKRRSGARIQVVGVVEDGKYLNLTEDQQAAMFFPILQSPSIETWMVVRSGRDPQQLATAIRNTFRDLDSGLSSFIQTWPQLLDGVLFPSRIATASLGVLGLMGAMLALTGIFGMAAYSVSKRLRELGIRMALGARSREILQAALGRALRLLAFGSAAGLLCGILAARVLASIVYHASPRDPLVLGGVVVAMLALGLLATWIPAQRALSVDPSVLLREQ